MEIFTIIFVFWLSYSLCENLYTCPCQRTHKKNPISPFSYQFGCPHEVEKWLHIFFFFFNILPLISFTYIRLFNALNRKLSPKFVLDIFLDTTKVCVYDQNVWIQIWIFHFRTYVFIYICLWNVPMHIRFKYGFVTEEISEMWILRLAQIENICIFTKQKNYKLNDEPPMNIKNENRLQSIYKYLAYGFWMGYYRLVV